MAAVSFSCSLCTAWRPVSTGIPSIINTGSLCRRKAAERLGRQKKRETLLELQERLKKVMPCSRCSAGHRVVVHGLAFAPVWVEEYCLAAKAWQCCGWYNP